MKKLISICLVLLMSVAILSSCNQLVEEEKIATEDALEFHLLEDGTYGVSAGDANNFDKVVIPSTHNDKPVTKVMDKAFFEADNIKTIIVPDSVTSIGEYAFSECSSLKNLTIGNGVTYVGQAAFNNSHKLEYNRYDNGYYLGNNTNPYVILVFGQITHPDKIISSCEIHSQTKIIHFAAFYNNDDLKSITIPNGVIFIGNGAFGHCDSLESVTIPGSVKGMDAGVFSKCSGLKYVTVDEGVTTLGEYMFDDCTSLEIVSLPKSLKTIEDAVFADCTSLESINFGGTKEQWNDINKSSIWDVKAGNYTVHCSGR